MQRFVFAPILLAIMLGAVTARAEQPEAAALDSSPHVAVSGTFGIATPLGIAGVELEAHLARWLSLSAGVGLGASGPQVAVMPRVGVAMSDVTNLYLGVGLSAGRYTWNELLVFDEPAKKTWERAFWLNGELGIDRQLGSSAWSGRLFLGIGQVLNDQDFMCNDDHCLMDHEEDGLRQKYVGFALARSFRSM